MIYKQRSQQKKKEIENLKVLLEEKEYTINILEETQSKNETTISVMEEEIENYKNEKQILANSIKQKTEETHVKNKTIQDYESKCSKNKTTIKKQETQMKSITDNRNRIQNDLNQIKNEIRSLQKDFSELIQKHQQLEQKYFESQDNCSSKETNIEQLEDNLKQKENTISTLKVNIENNKKFTENNQNHKTNVNEMEIHNSTQQDQDYVMKQNAKANTTCQTATQTKTLNHENVSIRITENVTQNNPNIDPGNNSRTHEAINETTKKISIPSDLVGNVIGKNGYRVQQIQNTCNVKIHTKFQNRSIQDIKVTGNEHQVNMSLNEINNIVTCANYLNKTCHYGRHCQFLHYSLHPKVINKQQTVHNEPYRNNEMRFTKQQQQKYLTPNKNQTQNNSQQVDLKEQLTQLLKQKSIKEMLQTTMINTLTQMILTATL